MFSVSNKCFSFELSIQRTLKKCITVSKKYCEY